MLIHYSSLLSSFADKKGMANETTEMNRESVESSVNSTSNNNNNINNINAPKYGTVVPNRIFVGGISSSTTEADLAQLFSNYGHVVETKVIADRAGVSKGYGFVTFETEDEAKRLQKDSDNIVLRERRLNIAPAIKKQGFTRNTYEAVHTGTSSPVPMPTNQIVRQNGVTFTFHNGMAFFPQQAIHSQATSPVTHIQNHVESTPVYATGSPYSGVTQASTPPTFPFSYLPQGQIFYHPAHYPYHVPIESCYSIGENHNGVMIPAQASGESGGVILPGQYYITHAPPQTEMAYYNPQSPITQISIPPQETPMPPIIYATPRNFEQNSSALVYSEGGRGRNKWYNRESIIESGIEDGNCVMPNTLTPPITPRSPQGNEATQTEDVLNSMQTLAI
ncbi:hypothetical protein O3M35_013070 [Rhynocoris fuscipes]|uniref:RRM domain-containing protein n=1 Tax=Rhynocoris fuscipes TaxID=488301 RepID=A0AAW1CFR5_9HEMI